jgi:hypothetical protein
MADPDLANALHSAESSLFSALIPVLGFIIFVEIICILIERGRSRKRKGR